MPARGDFVRRFDELLQLFARPDRLGHLRAVNLLEGLLLHLADSRRPEKALWLDRAKELVLQLPGFRPDYSWVADQLGMALSTFRRAFRREGVAVHQFLLHSRIETAKYLLAETQAPIKSIARQLGYRDVFFFSRQFPGCRDATGHLPQPRTVIRRTVPASRRHDGQLASGRTRREAVWISEEMSKGCRDGLQREVPRGRCLWLFRVYRGSG